MKNVIGHKKLFDYFQKCIERNNLSHAHILFGEDGIGKSIIAKNVALKLLTDKNVNSHIDLIEYKSKNNKKSIGVDDVRELIEKINMKPYENDKKVIIVYKTETMTIAAQNTFLKTIEEPPKGVYIFLLTNSLYDVLDTIKSRCQIHKLQKLDASEMNLYINENYSDIDSDKRKMLLNYSDGIPGKIDYILKDDTFETLRALSQKILLYVINKNKNSEEIITQIKSLKDSLEQLINILLSYIRDIFITKYVSNNELLINKDDVLFINEISEEISFNSLNKLISILDEFLNNTKYSTNIELSIEILLYNLKN